MSGSRTFVWDTNVPALKLFPSQQSQIQKMGLACWCNTELCLERQ